MTYSDATLLAYLNRDLPDDDLAAIDAALAQDGALDARLRALDPMTGMVADAFDTVAPAPVVPASVPQTSTPWLRYAATLAAGVVIGAGLMMARPDAPTLPDWRMQVAQYQQLYTPQTVAAITTTDADLTAQLAMVSAAIGADVSVADLSGLDGLTLRRAQLLGLQGGALVQIVFAADDGTPIALCLVQSDAGTDRAAQTLQGMASAHWSNDSHEFLLIGGDNPAKISSWANQIIPRLEA